MKRPSPEVEEIVADIDLCRLDIAARGMKEDAIVLEVSKAITIAALHRDMEARVVCRTIPDFVDALLILGGEAGRDVRGVWSITRGTLELPNGSVVVVKYEPEATPRAEGDGT